MPTYEMPLLLRIMSRPEVVSTLKRTSEAIFETGGFIRQLENLGTREIPYKTSAHGQVHKKASYFLLKFDCPPKHLDDLSEGYGRDVDIIRHRLYKVKDPEQFECTIEEETKPPAYRKDVQEMMKGGGKKRFTHVFNYNTGLDYFPFQK